MAVRKYGINLGEDKSEVVESAYVLPLGYGIELYVDLSQFTYRQDVILAVQEIIEHILEGNYPPV